MSVAECDVSRHGALGKELIDRADFRDAFRAPLSRSDLSVPPLFALGAGHKAVAWVGV